MQLIVVLFYVFYLFWEELGYGTLSCYYQNDTCVIKKQWIVKTEVSGYVRIFKICVSVKFEVINCYCCKECNEVL
jgi:hypothetical protein